MKTKILVLYAALCILCSSCASICGGPITDCQRTRPDRGSPGRQVRVAALILDVILFWPGAVIDFADDAIYRPCAMTKRASYR